MTRIALHAITFLAPNMFSVYQAMIEYLSLRLGIEIGLSAGESYDEVATADLCFICGLPYVLRTVPRGSPLSMEAIAAPVLVGKRHRGQPIYFSDVIVGRDSPYKAFRDLRGRSWAYNEAQSQSGYGITRYTLVKLGETGGFFGEVIGAGFHQKAIRMVCDGSVDAAAIDEQVLAVELRDYPELGNRLHVIDSLGPSTIQPIAVSSKLAESLKEDIRGVLLQTHTVPSLRAHFDRTLINHWAAVDDSTYDDIREMLAACQRANFLQLR